MYETIDTAPVRSPSSPDPRRLATRMEMPPRKAGTKLTERAAPHIVVVGGGVAGLILATRLGHSLGRRKLARISLIDRSWVHVWKPMLHTFAAGTWNIYEQQVHYVAHGRAHHFEYVPGQLDAIDRTARRIRLAPLRAGGESVAGAREVDYDVLVLAFGSRANDFGTPGVRGSWWRFMFSFELEQLDTIDVRPAPTQVLSFRCGCSLHVFV